VKSGQNHVKFYINERCVRFGETVYLLQPFIPQYFSKTIYLKSFNLMVDYEA
jgi:hypothetical protein